VLVNTLGSLGAFVLVIINPFSTRPPYVWMLGATIPLREKMWLIEMGLAYHSLSSYHSFLGLDPILTLPVHEWP